MDIPIEGDYKIFKLTMNKRALKNALQFSFTTQWIKQLLEWPKRFDKNQRARLPLERATIEMKRSLYAKDHITGLYTRSINKGLFSHLGYRWGGSIVKFVGVTRTKAEYEALYILEPYRRSYSLISRTNGVVLDCYDHHLQGLCVASFANSSYACYNTITKRLAVDWLLVTTQTGIKLLH